MIWCNYAYFQLIILHLGPITLVACTISILCRFLGCNIQSKLPQLSYLSFFRGILVFQVRWTAPIRYQRMQSDQICPICTKGQHFKF